MICLSYCYVSITQSLLVLYFTVDNRSFVFKHESVQVKGGMWWYDVSASALHKLKVNKAGNYDVTHQFLCAVNQNDV